MRSIMRVGFVGIGILFIALGILLFLVDVSRSWNLLTLALGALFTVLGAWYFDT